MPKLKNDQHEKFVQELVKGASQTDAYAAAGYKADNRDAAKVSASRLLTNVNVQERLKELQEKAVERTEMTLDRLIDMAEEVYLAAKSDAAYGPAVSAIKEIGVLTGLRVEKSDRTTRTVTDVADLGPDEIDALLARELTEREEASVRGTEQPDSIH